MKNKEEIQELIGRYVAGKCTEEEAAWVETWYNQEKTDTFSDLSAEDIEQDLHEVFAKLPKKQPKRLVLPYRVAAAAVVLIAISLGLYFYYPNLKEESLLTNSLSEVHDSLDIAPGGNRATLTLADGTDIFLDDVSSGQIAQQAGLNIEKTEDGLVTYTVVSAVHSSESEVTFNTISTPKGGQYQVVLSDGTKVWLNAASTLTFPTSFIGDIRSVELSGEGYFEVNRQSQANAALKPFIITSGNQQVKVLGTHFNINSYVDEPSIVTTLLEGSIEVSDLSNLNKRILKPNEQSQLTANNQLRVDQVNSEHAVAWKSGMFQFQGTDIENVMRQLSRWYDVDVEFEGEVPNIKLWGEVYRNVNASQALEILEYFNLKYKITQTSSGRKIIIS